MIENQITRIYYCQNCGWCISDKELENRLGTIDTIYYCERCGDKLILNNFNFNEDNYYTVRHFFYDLKKKISEIEHRKLSFFQISLNYLNKKNKWYIHDNILRSKSDPDWNLSVNIFNSYEKALKSKLGSNFVYLEEFFKKYYSINLRELKLRDYNNYTKNYFKKIDTKDKMYWFCWILADGNFTRKTLRISINPKDGILFKRFIEDLRINSRWIRFEHSFKQKTQKYYKRYIIELHNKELVDNLREGAKNHYPIKQIWKNFLIGKKSNKIRFPRYAAHDVLMAGLLGFFDGDGTHSSGTPRIDSLSESFLWDIVEIFNLPSYMKPKPHYSHNKIETYYLDIGAELFMDLLKNYERSLPRKRKNYWRFCNKFLFTKDQLQALVAENPGISGQGIADKHFKLTGVKIGRRTAIQKMKEWNIRKHLIEVYYRQRTIELLKENWSLKRIWTEEFGRSIISWDKNRWRFFKWIFKDDPLVINGKDNIIKRIEEVYKPKS